MVGQHSIGTAHYNMSVGGTAQCWDSTLQYVSDGGTAHCNMCLMVGQHSIGTAHCNMSDGGTAQYWDSTLQYV